MEQRRKQEGKVVKDAIEKVKENGLGKENEAWNIHKPLSKENGRNKE